MSKQFQNMFDFVENQCSGERTCGLVQFDNFSQAKMFLQFLQSLVERNVYVRFRDMQVQIKNSFIKVDYFSNTEQFKISGSCYCQYGFVLMHCSSDINLKAYAMSRLRLQPFVYAEYNEREVKQVSYADVCSSLNFKKAQELFT